MIQATEGSAQENTGGEGPQGPGAAPRRKLHIGALAALLATAVATLWTGLDPLAWVVGSPIGETDNHRWMMWRAGRAALGDSGPWSNLPVGESVPLMDPANLPLYLPVGLLDSTLGWNLFALGAVMLAGLGGWALARELRLEPDAAVLAGVAAASSPFLAGVVDFGITESWGIGWFGLHAACLLAHARTGRAIHALGAGLALAAVANSGWYHAVFGLVVEAVLVAWALRLGGVRRLPGVLAQGVLAAVLTVPALLRFLDSRGTWAGRIHVQGGAPTEWRPNWANLPIQGTDLLNLLLPRLDADAPSKAAYLGVVLLCLVALGLVRRPRLAGALVLVALGPLALALGPWPSVAGHSLGLSGPARWLVSTVPQLSGISHWYRAVGAAVPFLAVAAAVGVSGLPGGRRLRVVLGLALVLDALALSSTPWPRPAIRAGAPESLLELARRSEGLEQGAVLQLPFDNGRQPFTDTPARIYDRWQVEHGLPRSESYEAVDALLARSDLVAGWQAATGQVSTLPPEQVAPRMTGHPPVLRDPSAIAREVERLRSWGYGWVVLHVDRCPEPTAARRALEAALGSPERIGPDLVWRIDG